MREHDMAPSSLANGYSVTQSDNAQILDSPVGARILPHRLQRLVRRGHR
jgi:hypothetical protein